jgi:hypothetical protein
LGLRNLACGLHKKFAAQDDDDDEQDDGDEDEEDLVVKKVTSSDVSVQLKTLDAWQVACKIALSTFSSAGRNSRGQSADYQCE